MDYMFTKVSAKCGSDNYNSTLSIIPQEATSTRVWLTWTNPDNDNLNDSLQLTYPRLRALGQAMIDIADKVEGKTTPPKEIVI